LTSTLTLIQPVGKPTDEINTQSQDKGPETVTLASLIEKGTDEIRKFKAEHPADYAKLYKEHYGREYVPEK